MSAGYRTKIAALILVVIVGNLLPVIPAAAQSANDQDDVGQVPTGTVTDAPRERHEMIKAAGIALMNTALKSMNRKLNQTIVDKLGVKSYLLYQRALVQGKYLSDAIRADNTDAALAASGSILDTVSQFENFPLNKMPLGKAIDDLAIRTLKQPNAAARKRYAQKLVAGASLMYTSAVVCDGVNVKALENTARFLSRLSSGVSPYDVNPRNGLAFYQQMGALGSPYSDESFWKLQLQNNGQQLELNAKNAAFLEAMGTGLKTTQQIDPRTGKVIGTDRPLNLITVGQQNSNQALYNIAIKGSDTVYDTSDFRGFLLSVITIKVGDQVANLLYKKLGKIPIIGGLFTKFDWLRTAVSDFAGVFAAAMVKKYAMTLYNDLSRQLFHGQILGEFTGCPQTKFKESKQANPNYRAADLYFPSSSQFGSADVDYNNVELVSSPVTFDVTPYEVNAGDTVTLSWDATGVGGATGVTISGGGVVATSRPLHGDPITDTVSADTDYTLTVVGIDPPLTEVRRVKIFQQGDQVTFAVTPPEVHPGDTVSLQWNASAIAGATEVTINGGHLNSAVRAVAGVDTDTVSTDTTYTLTVNGTGITRTASVTVTAAGEASITAQPLNTEEGRKTKVIWDASAVTNSSIGIIGLDPPEGWPPEGDTCYDMTEDNADFQLTVPGSTLTREVTVVSLAPVPPLQFDTSSVELHPDETAVISWSTGHPDAIVKLNGGVVGNSGSLEVGPGDYEISVDEANGCGNIESRTIHIEFNPEPPLEPGQ